MRKKTLIATGILALLICLLPLVGADQMSPNSTSTSPDMSSSPSSTTESGVVAGETAAPSPPCPPVTPAAPAGAGTGAGAATETMPSTAPAAPSATETPAMETPAAPSTTETPDMETPATPGTTETPVAPDATETPAAPETEAAPGMTETPAAPETPATPEPAAPATGAGEGAGPAEAAPQEGAMQEQPAETGVSMEESPSPAGYGGGNGMMPRAGVGFGWFSIAGAGLAFRSHLVGEHGELHSLWSIVTQGKRGFAHHPETMRWRGKLRALYLRHEALVEEMTRRGYQHNTPLDPALATGSAVQDEFLQTPEEQVEILRGKSCECFR